MPELEVIMKELGYTEGWLQLGVVDSEFLRQQYDEFQDSDDKNQEHYRHGAFIRFLNQRERLSEGEIEAIFELTDNGSDGCDLLVNRIMGLLESGLLTDDQLSELAVFPVVRETPIQKRYQRCLLIRRLTAEGLTDDVFDAICESQDADLHRVLLRRSDLSRDHVKWLSENGGNKSVRNQARQMLGSRRFRTQAESNQ